MNNTALQLRTDTAALMPAMSVQDAVERYGLLVQFVSTLLKADIDYGQIPGTNKPTLLKPGAEKLLTFFGLTKRFTVLEKVEDWIGDEHLSEPFFYYMYRCALYNGEQLIAESDGSCNSHESKYRYRKAERECPTCGKAAIIKGREEYGGGWVCFKKKDGCGAKFGDSDPAITSQQVGRVVNSDIADQVNTIQKMAQKRALIAATLLAVNASEFFTQDMEDMVVDAEVVEGKPAPAREPEPVRNVKLEGAQPTDTAQWALPELEGAAGHVVELAKKLKWSETQLAMCIEVNFGLMVMPGKLKDYLQFATKDELRELYRIMNSQRKGGKQ